MNQNIFVYTHNPKGDWGDIRPILDNGCRKGWNKGNFNLQNGDCILLYISKGPQRYEYICKAKNVTPKTFDMILVEKLDNNTANQLTYNMLKNNGLAPNSINYILNNNNDLYSYVTNVLNNELSKCKNFNIESFDCNENQIDDFNNDKPKLQPINQILYGPPGTGKTYHTINKAIEIIDNEFFHKHKEPTSENRVALKNKFDQLRESGQIVFTTFHQSFGYEEFVEGIKASTTSNGIEYNIESGIFKLLCEKANTTRNTNFEERIEWLKKECSEAEGKSIRINTFTVTYRDGKTFRIRPDNSNNKEADYPASIENIKKMYEGALRKEVYNPTYVVGILDHLYKNDLIKYDDAKNENNKNYVLIVDEINRGNISKIFGELITLIEPSKRIGADEEIRVKLPYSGDSEEPFGVPSNLYIIGTMNTADRSIALMDTALRRRFHFEEMMPDLKVVETLDNVDGINIKALLETINKRIEYLYDRDHTIGHAYFMSLKSIKDEAQKKDELDNIFRNKIIPLLQEYFYDDWEKIQMVLGDHPNQNAQDDDKFIKNFKSEENVLFGFNHEDIEDDQNNYIINKSFTSAAYTKIREYSK